MQVDLTPRAVTIIKGLRSERGMTQKAAVERVLQWFTDLPDSVRDAVLIRSGDPGAELLKIARAKQADATNLSLQAALQQAEDALAQVKRLSLAYELRVKQARKSPGK